TATRSPSRLDARSIGPVRERDEEHEDRRKASRAGFFLRREEPRSRRTELQSDAQSSSGAGLKNISRTSIGARHALAALRAHASASSRSATSTIVMPPTS